ncbi:dihydroorotase [Vulcanisaeta distributa]|uniref:Dihydroorotase n=1 Tax=Vulcanisaeta distributa (strain DSM 14429 / JCM 11212 / NBRC 100878 / IC-017) TaxID=572478 RepID=E1QT54_VULDI|nr:dihydroorotase family protein [Vulcanisaeta distributa]ADN49646.1 dihydroorotase, multifunctional complex type [Vulcanisaeta distributa DSM 14429]
MGVSKVDVLIKARAYVRGGVREVYIGITGSEIAYIGNEPIEAGNKLELPNQYLVLPGLVDVHVHFRDFDLSYKEDAISGTQAALAGGYTAVGEMPNTRPPIKTVELLRRKIEEFGKKTNLHIRHYFGAPQDPSLLKDALNNGAYAVGEVFPEEVLEYGGDQYLESLFREAARVGIPVIMHCEDPIIINQYSGPRGFEYHNAIRGPRAELACVHNVIRLVYRYGTKVHITHITLPQSISMIRLSGLDITFDVTPHHMLLSQEECLARAEKPAYCKVNPPLRDETTRRELLAMFVRGEVPIVASDHAPHADWEKDKPYDEAPPGIVGLETTAPLLLTLWRRGFVDLGTVMRAIQERPAKFLGLNVGIKQGSCADLTIINTKARHRIEPEKFRSKAKYSPFKGFEVDVAVVATILHGKLAYISEGHIDDATRKLLESSLPH